MKLVYPAIFIEGEGGYSVEVPDLPGCVSGGATLVEAIIMGVDAASGWVLTELEDGKPIPTASTINDIHPDADGFVNLLLLDMDSYIEQYGNKLIPQYDNGSGDYTKERGKLLKDVTMDDIKQEIAALSAGKTPAPATEKERERAVSEGFVHRGVVSSGLR
ncbi:hypothetical protein FACS1894200_05970 [Spirochaetia bacterium]|nr:hypothetical protein FACS1894200_01240 [Spirochaetia bacterium]GHU48596.1 hypothetical protein FACS1894200_05970 [Spirochaetia bacterium]